MDTNKAAEAIGKLRQHLSDEEAVGLVAAIMEYAVREVAPMSKSKAG